MAEMDDDDMCELFSTHQSHIVIKTKVDPMRNSRLLEHFYYDPVRNALVPFRRPKPDLIVERLYLGDQKNAYDADIINHYGITHVLSVIMVDNMYGHLSQFAPHIQVKVIPVMDEKYVNIKQYFRETNAFIDEGLESGGTVLVHCVWGMSRSSTIVIAYMMHRYNMEFPEAYKAVQKMRPIAVPNEGFVRQLIEFGEERLQVEFTIHYMTKYGENLHIVGNVPELGNWTPNADNKMEWVGSGVWRLFRPIFGRKIEYKYVVVDVNGRVIWESCGNHSFDGSRRFVRDCWNGGALPISPHC